MGRIGTFYVSGAGFLIESLLGLDNDRTGIYCNEDSMTMLIYEYLR